MSGYSSVVVSYVKQLIFSFFDDIIFPTHDEIFLSELALWHNGKRLLSNSTISG